jgi:RNA polymerase sigma-70 factor (ECF subfamily)
MEYAEIAEVTGASLGTVKSRIARARMKMRALISERAELLPHPVRPTGEH